MSVVLFMLFGLSVGVAARFLVPGNDPWGWAASIALGVLGASLGAFFGRVVGLYREGEPAGLFASIFGAGLMVLTYHAVTRRRRWREERVIR